MEFNKTKVIGSALAAVAAGVVAGIIPFAGVVLSAAGAGLVVWKLVSVKDLQKALDDIKGVVK
jgi:hypothetical protein